MVAKQNTKTSELKMFLRRTYAVLAETIMHPNETSYINREGKVVKRLRE